MLSGWWFRYLSWVLLRQFLPLQNLSIPHNQPSCRQKLGNAKMQEASSGTTKSLWIQGCACQEQTGAWPKQPHSSTLVTSDHFLITSLTSAFFVAIRAGTFPLLLSHKVACPEILSAIHPNHTEISLLQTLKWPASMPRSPRTFSASPS